MSNPILSSDLYKDEGDIKAAIEDLKGLRTEYQEAVKKISTEAIKMTVEVNKANVATEAQREQLGKTAKSVDKLAREKKKYTDLLSDNAKELAILKNAQIEQRRINKLEAKSAVNKATAYNKVSAQYSLNAIRLNKLTKAEQENTVSGRRLVKQTRELYEEMIRLQSLRGKDQLKVGKYGEAVGGLTSNLKTLLGTYLSIQGVFQGVRTVFANTKEIDSLNLAYEKTIPNTERLAQANEFLVGVSGRYGINILNLRKAYLRYNAAVSTTNLTTEQTQKVFESVSKATSVLGLGAAKTDRVFNALEQIISKGKVSSEELRQQLGDSLPGSLQIMAKALGVTTFELDKMLKNGEVLSEVAIPKFAAELEKAYGVEHLDRVDNLAAAQGRFESALINAIDSLKGSQAFKDFFNTMADGLGFITRNINAIFFITKAVTLAAVAYGTYRTAVALSNVTIKSSTLLLYRELAARKGVTLATVVGSKAVKAFNAAVRANPIGLVITLLATAATAYTLFANEVSATEKVMSSVGATTRKRLVDERVELEKLLAIAKDENQSKRDRQIAVAKLNSISPEYLGNLTLESVKTGEAKEAIDKYIKSVEQRIRIRAAEEKLTELEKQRIDDLNDGTRTQTTLLQKARDLFFSFGNGSVFAMKQAKQGIDNAVEAEKEFIKQKEKLLEIITKEGDINDRVSSKTPTRPSGGAGAASNTDANRDAFKAIELELSAKEDGREKDLELLKLNLEKKKIEFQKYGLDTNILIEQYNRERAAINRKYSDLELERLAEIEKKELERIKKAEEQKAAEEKKFQELKEKRKKDEFELFSQLQARDKSEFDLLVKTAKEKEEFALQAEVEKLEKILELNERFGGEMTSLQVQIARNQIQAIKNEISSLGKSQTTDIYEILGFKVSDKQKEALSTSLEFAKEQYQQLTEERLRLAEQNVTQTNAEVASTERALQREIENRNSNHAHNVETATRELAEAKANQSKALAERRKAQREQGRIQSLERIANLITASSKIWGQLGFPAALPALGIMWGSFAASKIRANKLAKQEFRDGGLEWIGGGSHASGNDTPLPFTTNGKQAYAEKGEAHMIIKRSAARKAKGILPQIFKSLNRGTFENDYMSRTEMIAPTNNVVVDLTRTEDELVKIRQQGEQVQPYRDSNGNLVVTMGNRQITYV